MRSNGALTKDSRRAIAVFSMRSRRTMSSPRSASTALKMYFRNVFGQRGVVVQVGEGDFRFDHPELGQVARGVRVLGTEGRAEGVDLAQRQAIGLDVELAGHRQVGLLAEEVLVLKSIAPLSVRGHVREIERGDAEHLPGALAVAGGHDRRVDPEEAALVEEAVDGLGDAVAHARHRAEGVGARAQVRHFAQELQVCGLGWIG
jgi:hypothetical protein